MMTTSFMEWADAEVAPPRDCIIIGYNDVSLIEVEASTKRMQKHSGAYRNLCTNTMRLNGQRMHLMDVLSQAINPHGDDKSRLHVGKLPNMAVYYLTSFLRKRGFDAIPINFFNDEKATLKDLLSEKPLTVAITTTFYVEAAPIIEIINYVRKISPDSTIIVGGPHIYNICSKYEIDVQNVLLGQIGADVYIFDSQGEDTLSKLLTRIKLHQAYDDLENIITRHKEGFFHTPRRVEDNNLDENAINWADITDTPFVPAVQMRTARSCAFRCSFCRYPLVAGALTLSSLDSIEMEMKYLVERGTKQFVFIDDTFNVPLRRFKDICRMIIKNNFNIEWYSYFRCANADDEAFDLMKESGCAGVFLGLESADSNVLEIMNKSADPGRYRRGIQALNSRGIATFVSIIVGFPGETGESIKNTICFLQETKPTFFRAELYYHDEHTPIQGRAAEFNLKGGGYSWSHKTMNWQSACDHIDIMYKSITDSTILPLYMFDFWSIPYLRGCDIPLSKIIQFLNAVRPAILREDMGHQWENNLQLRIKEIFDDNSNLI